MSRRGGLGGSNRGSFRRSKWEQEMAREDATKKGFPQGNCVYDI